MTHPRSSAVTDREYVFEYRASMHGNANFTTTFPPRAETRAGDAVGRVRARDRGLKA